MPFELRLERAPPPLTSEDAPAVALAFLRKVGVVAAGYDPLGAGPGGPPTVRVLVECLLGHPERSWAAAEMSKVLSLPVGHVYRAVLKFEALDWVSTDDEGPKGALAGKRFRLRFGTAARAWRFSDLGASLCLERYGALAATIESRVAPHRAKAPARPAGAKGAAPSPSREAFVMQLSDRPLPTEGTPKDLSEAFLLALGAIGDRTGGRKVSALPSFRLFYSAFLLGGDRWWALDELAKEAPSTRPTLMKHLRRLEGLDLLERSAVEDEFGIRRGQFRLRHGSLARAFEFTQARARLALDSMGRWAEHLDKLVEAGGTSGPKGSARRR
jgi:hypothetical protein